MSFMPPASAVSSAWSRSTKPWVRVVPPVTTTFERRAEWRSGSIWTSELEKRREMDWRAEYGWDGTVEADGGRGREANWRGEEGQFSWRREIEGRDGGTDLLGHEARRVEEDFWDAHPQCAKVRVVAVWEFERSAGLRGHEAEEEDFAVVSSDEGVQKRQGGEHTRRPKLCWS